MALPVRSSGSTLVVSRLLLLLVVVPWWWVPYPVVRAGVPVPAQYYTEQSLDHTATDLLSADNTNNRTWTQRYYTYPEFFAGPGSPIFVIFGGEGAIEPTTGIMYPFVAQHLTRDFGAFVLQPEHRFYGASQPIDPATIHEWRAQPGRGPDPRVRLLSYEQALGDAVQLLHYLRDGEDALLSGCSTDRRSDDYCPIIAVGGSYPGFLAAMARMVYPHVFDMAYAASAPMKFYAQQLLANQSAYYDHIAAVAEQAVPGCRSAVQSTLRQVQQLFDNNNDGTVVDPSDVGVCPGTVPDYSDSLPSTFFDELHMMIGYTFANMNMAYYPPSNTTALHRACVTFLDDALSAVDRVRTVLVRELGQSPSNSCFDMAAQRPGGPHATISAGDWSGVGTGPSGESWDFQTCTYCVESIGFNAKSSGMFLDRPWSLDWLTRHCQSRFAVTPDPYQINRRWGIDNLLDKANASYILFTNGLKDGWSVSGIRDDLSATVLALNFPNGAHHSDLSGVGPTDHDTIDIQTGFLQVRTILAAWLSELRISRSSSLAS